jgi:hypothetical protein
MSAVASTEALRVSVPVAAHTGSAASEAELEAAEQRRWMTWFGLPIAVAALFLGLTFGTGQEVYLALAIGAFVTDVGILIWLAMSSDTNGIIGEPAGAH